MAIKDGGPAFPQQMGGIYYGPQGMTLRDYFAGKALQGMCAWGAYEERRDVASEAYELADAMLKAREQQ